MRRTGHTGAAFAGYSSAARCAATHEHEFCCLRHGELAATRAARMSAPDSTRGRTVLGEGTNTSWGMLERRALCILH